MTTAQERLVYVLPCNSRTQRQTIILSASTCLTTRLDSQNSTTHKASPINKILSGCRRHLNRIWSAPATTSTTDSALSKTFLRSRSWQSKNKIIMHSSELCSSQCRQTLAYLTLFLAILAYFCPCFCCWRSSPRYTTWSSRSPAKKRPVLKRPCESWAWPTCPTGYLGSSSSPSSTRSLLPSPGPSWWSMLSNTPILFTCGSFSGSLARPFLDK